MLTREDLLGPDRTVIDHRWEQMDVLCEILEGIDPDMRESCFLSNRTMWHYSLHLKGSGYDDRGIAVTTEFEDMSRDGLEEYAKVVYQRYLDS